jgi:hypothetical protein
VMIACISPDFSPGWGNVVMLVFVFFSIVLIPRLKSGLMNKSRLVLVYRGLKSPEIIRVKFAGISPDFSPGWGECCDACYCLFSR